MYGRLIFLLYKELRALGTLRLQQFVAKKERTKSQHHVSLIRWRHVSTLIKIYKFIKK
jgi:hypothetical protein